MATDQLIKIKLLRERHLASIKAFDSLYATTLGGYYPYTVQRELSKLARITRATELLLFRALDALLDLHTTIGNPSVTGWAARFEEEKVE